MKITKVYVEDMLNQVKLPNSLRAITISEMKKSQSTFTVPWAMYVDERDILWLDGSHTLNQKRGGTVQMKINKNAKGEYICDVSNCKDYKWIQGYKDTDKFIPLPVTKIIW